jgi:hypothetical protein
MALKIHLSEERVMGAGVFQTDLQVSSQYEYYFGKALDGVILAYCSKTKTFIRYDCVTGERREERVLPSAKDAERMERIYENHSEKGLDECVLIHQGAVYERDYFTLTRFLDFLDDARSQKAARGFYEEISQNTDGTAGKTIYKTLTKNI